MRLGRSRPMSLREAASVVFAIVAVVPILLLAYVLSRARLLGQVEARVALLLAVAVSVVGFVVLRRMMDQIARMVQGLQAPLAGQPAALPDEAKPILVPGLGQVTEISQLGDAFHHMLEDLRAATQRLEDLVFKLGTLNELVELSARIPKIKDLLGHVLQSTMRAVRATIGSIMILDKERQTLRVVVSRGIPEDVDPEVEVRVGEDIAGKVVTLGEPVLVDDIATDPRFRKASAPRYGNGSFICMPIRAGERIIGVINMAKKRVDGAGAPAPQPFGTVELQFLNTLMTYIGYSVDNARLLEEAQQSAQRLQGVVDDLRSTQAAVVRSETLRAIGQLSSGVAHHLNNLFAVILGRTELLLRRVEDPDIRRALDIILQTAQDGAEVVRRVQRFSRVQPVSQPVAVDLNQLAQDVVELTRPRWYDEAQLRGSRVEVVLERGQIPAVAGEPAPLREVLMNLVLNATDAISQAGRITIRTWAKEDRVQCTVTDTGRGMSEEVRRRVLEPFFTTKGPKATGLGLSVAYGTVQRHGGTLTIDSVEGQGTTVTISLPAVAPIPLSAPVPPEVARPVFPLRILVIDDELRVRTTLAELLTAEGHTVLQACGGREGLDLLAAEGSIDLVLTDLGMPDMTGWDVARAVRERWPGLPVGLITGWGEQDLAAGEHAWISFVISKPFEDATLREALAGVRPGR